MRERQWIFSGLAAAVAIFFIGAAQANAEGKSLPDWITAADYGVKARVRYEWISNENPTPSNQIDRNRFRYLLLMGATFHPDPNLDLEVRLGTAGTSAEQASSTSQNNTFDDSFRDDPLFIDRMAVTWRPEFTES